MSPGLVRRAYQGAFSRGYGYEPHEAGTRFLVDGIGGYFIDYRPKIGSQAANPEQPLYPADLAQLALAWWELVLLDEPGAADEFMRQCVVIERGGETNGGTLRWPYHV